MLRFAFALTLGVVTASNALAHSERLWLEAQGGGNHPVGAYSVQVKPDTVLREYAVYAASLEPADSALMAAQGGVHRVRAHTDALTGSRYPDGQDFIEQAAERMQLPAGLFADFRRRNREFRCLDADLFPTKARVVLIAEDGQCSGTPAASVPTPRDALLTTFSRVGFTSEGEDALTLERFDCGARCGEIGFAHYKRVAGRWKKHRYERIAQF